MGCGQWAPVSTSITVIVIVIVLFIDFFCAYRIDTYCVLMSKTKVHVVV